MESVDFENTPPLSTIILFHGRSYLLVAARINLMIQRGGNVWLWERAIIFWI